MTSTTMSFFVFGGKCNGLCKAKLVSCFAGRQLTVAARKTRGEFLFMVSRHLIKELQTILKKDYEKDLELVEVSEIAQKLVDYFGLLAKIENKYNKESLNHEIFRKTI